MEFDKEGRIILPDKVKGKKKKIGFTEKIQRKETVVVVKEEESNTNPVVDIKCPRCKHKKAYFWTMQTRSSDESETKFYKCKNCSHTWRKYR